MREIVIVLDANFIMLPFQFKVDYLDQIEAKIQGKAKFIVFKQVIDELKAKAKREKRSNKFLLQLNSGLSYLKKYQGDYDIFFDHSVKSSDETTDQFLLMNCTRLKERGKLVFLATNDKELKRLARKYKISLIFLRQKKIISIERM